MQVLEKLSKIKAFAFDVDGVMTDGSLILSEEGKYLRTFNIRDGYAIRKAILQGYKIVVISGGKSEGVERRLRDLGVMDIYLGIDEKTPTLLKWLKANAVELEALAYMGDDILDLEAMQYANLKACPADAVPEVKSIVNYISPIAGGKGCVRDLIEIVLKAQDKWVS
jgi:3-deoxy-D-manno-octulosonate 8-phosphate phosphatase (KDO 8-P phosphatase)